MLTETEILELYEEINQPYTKEEFAKHCEDRLIKSWLEITHAHNYELIELVNKWEHYLTRGGEKPNRKLWVVLRPGKNNDNAACARLHDIADYFARFDHGNTPLLPILVYCSRSSLTLVDRLDDFFASGHLTEANHHIKEFFTLVAYHGDPQMSREEFRNELFAEINAFIFECSEYAKDLTTYMFSCMKGNKPATPEDVKKIVTSAKNELNRSVKSLNNKAISSIALNKIAIWQASGLDPKFKPKDGRVAGAIKELMIVEGLNMLSKDDALSERSVANHLIAKYQTIPGAYTEIETLRRALNRKNKLK